MTAGMFRALRAGFDTGCRNGLSLLRFSGLGPYRLGHGVRPCVSFNAAAARYYTSLNETGKTLLWNLGVIVLLLVLFSIPLCALAQDGHSRWHQYYQHWQQPNNPGLSCCNARQLGPNGEDLNGDCEPTQGRIRDGHWQAWLRQESRWLDIPDNKLIRERNPSGEEAHLCATKSAFGSWSILCFVPPDTGG